MNQTPADMCRMLKEYILHKRDYILGGIVEPSNFDRQCKIDVYADTIGQALRYNLRLHFMQYEYTEEKEDPVITADYFKYPSDWKEAFKERFFPKWLLRKFPIHYTQKPSLVKKVYVTRFIKNCPHMDTPDKEEHIRWMIHEPFFAPAPKGKGHGPDFQNAYGGSRRGPNW